jgi:hypothetical protein
MLLDVRVEGRAALERDRQARTPPEALEHLLERLHPLPAEGRPEPAAGVQTLELTDGARAYRAAAVSGALEREVVDDDGLIVSGEVHVQLQGVGTQRQRPLEGGDGILGRLGGGAAMGNDERRGGPHCRGPSPRGSIEACRRPCSMCSARPYG